MLSDKLKESAKKIAEAREALSDVDLSKATAILEKATADISAVAEELKKQEGGLYQCFHFNKEQTNE